MPAGFLPHILKLKTTVWFFFSMTELSDQPKTSVTSLGQAKWQGILGSLLFGTKFKMLLNKSALGA